MKYFSSRGPRKNYSTEYSFRILWVFLPATIKEYSEKLDRELEWPMTAIQILLYIDILNVLGKVGTSIPVNPK